MQKNVAGQRIGVQMVSASDGSAFTGSVTVYVTGDAGSQAIGSVGSGICTHEGNGYHSYAPAQEETNYDLIAFTFIGSGAVPVTVQVYTAINPVTAVPTAEENADAVWDEILTGATHNIATSAGRRLRQLTSVIVYSGTAQGAGTGNNQIQFDTGASPTDGAYDPGLVYIETGTGAGQTRLILQYNGNTRTATVDRDWRVNPDNTSEFVILGDAGRQHVNEGLAQAGTATTITLNANASSDDDAYNGQLIFIRSGTGQDQVALVEDYVGSTKVATIKTRSATGQWAVTPDSTSAYVMMPNLTWTVAEIQSGLATSSGVTAGFTEIKGATWSSSTDTLEAIRDASGGGGTSIMVTPVVAQVPVRVRDTDIETYIGDLSTIRIGIFSGEDAVDLSGFSDLEVCVQAKDGTDLDFVEMADLTIDGTDNNYVSWDPAGPSVATVRRGKWSLRKSSNKQVIAKGAWIVSDAALEDTGS